MRRVCIFIMLAASMASAISLVQNGSFEMDGTISDITSTPPSGWDVNLPGNFGGKVSLGWPDDDSNSLLISNDLFGSYSQGDSAYISQQVDLTDANKLIFNINLSGSYYGIPMSWDSNEVTAFIKMDNDSNDLWTSAIGADGIYNDVNVPVIAERGIHTLHFGVRVGISGTLSISYRVKWDLIKFDTYCGGFGYFESDLNQDCYVDFADFSIIAEEWFDRDMFDILILAEDWIQCTDWSNDDCVELPLYLDADINFDGIVNMADYAILANNFETISDPAADIDGGGDVDYKDIAIMKQQWLGTSWLYPYKN